MSGSPARNPLGLMRGSDRRGLEAIAAAADIDVAALAAALLERTLDALRLNGACPDGSRIDQVVHSAAAKGRR